MSERKIANITLENTRICFRNFQGKETDYNVEGDRNFCVLIDDNLAENLLKDGWNVKRLAPFEDDPEKHEQAYLKVKVKFGAVPPLAYIINSRGKLRLTEETIDQLDWATIDTVDVVIRPYEYPPSAFRPNGGIAAYLKAIYVTIKEDYLESKYADIPDLR